MLKETIHIALIQMDLTWENPIDNIEKIDKFLDQLTQPADIVFLPEMFSTGFSMNVKDLAESMDGETMKWMKMRSKQSNIALCGSLIIKEEGEYFNRLVFVEPEGKVYHYNKRHLFTMGNEESHFHKGSERLIINYKGWRICPLICYDIRFPVWSRNKDEYDLLVYVANWPANRSEVWDILLKARAIENQAYVAGINRVGVDGTKIHYTGDSQVLDAKGRCLANVNPGKEAVVKAQLSLSELERFRTIFPVLKDGDTYQFD